MAETGTSTTCHAQKRAAGAVPCAPEPGTKAETPQCCHFLKWTTVSLARLLSSVSSPETMHLTNTENPHALFRCKTRVLAHHNEAYTAAPPPEHYTAMLPHTLVMLRLTLV